MPKGFTEVEKERIIAALREEGQKLFVSRGIKKVTIDDLTQAAHIAKGSFYLFYKTKEELFLDISSFYQQKLFEDLEPILGREGYSNRQKVFAFLKTALEKLEEYPLLNMVDAEVVELLYRKLPREKVDMELQSDLLRLEIFAKHKIQFNYPLPVVVKVFQKAILAGLQDQADGDNHLVTEILLESVIEKVVKNNE
ncbi:TetR/AcrR family transcriptional regulator [Desulfitobacterium sp. AusDCA]|uniref:TetR/AcrR family transcriptional regulator n=1 Tax=Desulfitobacterium sp. AusDCA TaxID=3240383 RepID=UPI003DA7342E